MSTELRLSIDTRAIVFAGVATGAAYTLYRIFQAHAQSWKARAGLQQGGKDSKAQSAAAGEDVWQMSQQLQLHYGMSVLPALPPDMDPHACALEEV